jgi:signal transduction histidine kinase
MCNLVLNTAVFLMGFGVRLSSCMKRHWTGCILLCAWTLVSVLFFVFAATVVGWSSLGHSMGFNLALAGEAVFMSLPLAYRIRQLKLDRELSAMAAKTKGLFLARMSHEIRTPMTAIMGFTDIALRLPCQEQVRQCLLKVRVAAGHLLGLINEILDLAKIEAGRLDVERKAFDLNALVREVCDIVAPAASTNGNELLCDMDEGLPSRVLGDPMRRRQGLVNLAGNAVKFTTGGDVWIRVGLAGEGLLEASAERRRIRFEVFDTGPGIPEELMPRLFEPFEQGEGGGASRYGGTGLGLNISSRLVALMGGRIEVSSRSGQGAAFRFELDLDPVDGPGQEMSETPVELQGLSILVADDHPGARGNMVVALARLGFACEAVESGPRAVEAVERARAVSPWPSSIGTWWSGKARKSWPVSGAPGFRNRCPSCCRRCRQRPVPWAGRSCPSALPGSYPSRSPRTRPSTRSERTSDASRNRPESPELPRRVPGAAPSRGCAFCW